MSVGFLTAVSNLAYCNPFLAERTDFEKAALGKEFVAGGIVWSASVDDPDISNPNIPRLQARLEPLLDQVHLRLREATEIRPEELALYQDCVQYLLYQRFYLDFTKTKENAALLQPVSGGLESLFSRRRQRL